jgi:hypothetical protein
MGVDNLAPPEAVLTDRVVRSTPRMRGHKPSAARPAAAALPPVSRRGHLPTWPAMTGQRYLARFLARILSDEPGQLLAAISSAG